MIRRRRQQHGSHLLKRPEQRKQSFRSDTEVMGRRVGGVSHEFGKYCQAAEQDPGGKALLGIPSPRSAPVTAEPEKSHNQKTPPQNLRCCEPLAELQECCYLEINHWGDPQQGRAHPVQQQGSSAFLACQGSSAQQLCIPRHGKASQGL